MEFKIGDRVECPCGDSRVPGTLIKIKTHHIVELDEFNQHAYDTGCTGFGMRKVGWAMGVHESHLTLIPRPEPKPGPLPDDIEVECTGASCDRMSIMRTGDHIRFAIYSHDHLQGTVYMDSEKLVFLRDHLDKLLGDVIHE